MKKVIALLLISFFVLQLVAVPSVYAASLPFTALGTVLDRHGSPVKGATVTLYDGIYQEIGKTTSDEMGNFGFTNAIANSPGCKATISFKDGQKEYKIDLSNTIWYPTDQGIVKFDPLYTTLNNYPAPEYGYIWGLMQQDGAGQKALGNGVVYVASGDLKYYAFTDANKGTFLMRLPVGHYRVWGQYKQNGMVFQSSVKEVDVAGASNYLDVNNIVVSVPLTSATSNPNPENMPTSTLQNSISGYVTYKDGKPIPDQVVSLYQATDDGMSGYLKKGEIKTDANGYYQFYGVEVTADAPDNGPIFGSKSYNLTMVYTDPEGRVYPDSRKITLNNPNFITQDINGDQRTRNPVVNFSVQYSTQGWVKINTDTPDAKIYVNDKQIVGSDGKAVTLPYTAYLDPNSYMIRVSSPGYEDRRIPVIIMENQQTEDVFVHLDKSAFPSWVPLAAAVAILLIVALVFLVLVFTKRQMIFGMLGGVIVPLKSVFGKSIGNYKTSSQAKKAHKAQMAEVRKAEQARMAQVREASIASQAKIEGKNRDHEKAFTAKAEQPRLPEYRGGAEEDEKPSMVTARDIYKKQDRSSVERISSSHASKGPVPQAHSPAHEHKSSMAAEPDGRIRVPKSMPIGRDQPPATSINDKEKAIRYIREHPDGVSFIQMSNDLEISPNTLTIITKELVINDDIEKVKGVYYYKSHGSSSDDSSSSVVVWRLDGEE